MPPRFQHPIVFLVMLVCGCPGEAQHRDPTPSAKAQVRPKPKPVGRPPVAEYMRRTASAGDTVLVRIVDLGAALFVAQGHRNGRAFAALVAVDGEAIRSTREFVGQGPQPGAFDLVTGEPDLTNVALTRTQYGADVTIDHHYAAGAYVVVEGHEDPGAASFVDIYELERGAVKNRWRYTERFADDSSAPGGFD